MATYTPTDSVVPKRWTRSEYHRMAEVGLFGPNDRMELIEGAIIEVAPQGSRHYTVLMRVAHILQERIEGHHHLRTQGPLALADDSEPEPDIALVEGTLDDYADAHPTTARLVVEISDTTLAADRQVKSRVYARASIPEYWIVNLVDRQVEVYTEPGAVGESPTGFGYRIRRVAVGDDDLGLPGTNRSVRINELKL